MALWKPEVCICRRARRCPVYMPQMYAQPMYMPQMATRGCLQPSKPLKTPDFIRFLGSKSINDAKLRQDEASGQYYTEPITAMSPTYASAPQVTYQPQ